MLKNLAALLCNIVVTVVAVVLPAVVGDLTLKLLSGPDATSVTVIGGWIMGLLVMTIGTIVLSGFSLIITNVFNFFKYKVF